MKKTSMLKPVCLMIAIALTSQSFTSWAQTSSNVPTTENLISSEELSLAQKDGLNLAEQIDEIESGSLKNKPLKDFDLFKLADQSITVFNKSGENKTYQLNDYTVNLPQVVYTDLKIYFDETKKTLVFEALVGTNKNGENGTVVARQVIPNMDIAGLVRDEEIITLIDKSGKIHAIDFGYVVDQLFKSPIPVFQNLWEPLTNQNLNTQKIKLQYLTLGTRPFTDQEIKETSILPLDPQGKPRIKAGDLSVEIIDEKTQTRELVGVFSRSVMHEQMATGAQQLQLMSLLLNPDNEKIQLAMGIINDIEKNENIAKNQDLNPESMPLVIKKVFQQLKTTQIESLKNVTQIHNQKKMRTTGDLSLPSWRRDFETISQNLKNQNPDIDETLMAKNWPQGVKPLDNSPLLQEKNQPSRITKMLSGLQEQKNLNRLSALFSGASITYLGLPYAIDHYATLEQIKTLSWIYTHFYPAILKDSLYRTPLLLSTVSLIAIWPITVAISSIAGKAFQTMSDRLQNSKSVFAQRIRDIAKTWGPLNNWQRITTYGLRMYAWLMYPYWRVVSTMLRQKTFFTALENGVNPFTLVKKNSDLGKRFQIDQDTRIGLNSVFANQKTIEDKTYLNSALISAQAEERKKLENMSWALATLIVSEKNGYDPATFALIAGRKIAIDQQQIQNILSDPQIKAQWEITADQLLNQYLKLSESNEMIRKLSDAELLTRMHQTAQEISDKIQKQPDIIRKMQSLRLKFKTKARAFNQAALKIGLEEHQVLKSTFVNEDIAKQVKQEFTIDHLMVVLIVGFYGDRADFSNPQQLAADPNGVLWTSQAHWNDIFLNTFAHFFVSGSNMVLVLQKMKAQMAQSYRPIEDYLYVSRERTEPFFTGTKNWLKEVSNPMNADLGSVMLKRFSKKFKTFTAGLTMSLGIRTALQTSTLGFAKAFSIASHAYVFNFFAAYWYYGYIWEPIQVGNMLESKRIEKQNETLKQARFDLSQGNFQKGASELLKLYFDNNPEDLKNLELQMLQLINESDFKKAVLQKKSLRLDSIEQENYYFGLLTQLAIAQKNNNADKIELAKNSLIKLLAQDQMLNSNQLAELSSEGLLMFSVAHPPVYTSAHKTISWLTTWIGAVGSTILAIPLSVVLTTDSLMSDPVFIGKWMTASLTLYGVSYMVLSKKMILKYIDFYKTKVAPTGFGQIVSQLKNVVSANMSDYKNRSYQTAKTNLQSRQDLRAPILSCEGLFR